MSFSSFVEANPPLTSSTMGDTPADSPWPWWQVLAPAQWTTWWHGLFGFLGLGTIFLGILFFILFIIYVIVCSCLSLCRPDLVPTDLMNPRARRQRRVRQAPAGGEGASPAGPVPGSQPATGEDEQGLVEIQGESVEYHAPNPPSGSNPNQSTATPAAPPSSTTMPAPPTLEAGAPQNGADTPEDEDALDASSSTLNTSARPHPPGASRWLRSSGPPPGGLPGQPEEVGQPFSNQPSEE